jgi:hypothetical protein
MRRRWLNVQRFLLPMLVGLVLACQVIPTPPPLKATSADWVAQQATLDAATRISPRQSAPTATPQDAKQVTPAPGNLPPFPDPFSGIFALASPVAWEPPSSSAGVSLPVSLDQVANRAVLIGLSLNQRDFLSRNGFVIVHSREAQFSDIRERVSLYYGQPYYLTTDAAYHALHLSFDKLLEALEREELRPRMLAITQATLDEVLTYLPLVQAGDLEEDTRQAAAYLGVALRLFDPQAALPVEIEERVNSQVNQILAGGIAESTLFSGFQDDYSAYQPVGHYAADPELQSYFRAMTWFGRVNFSMADSVVTPSRLPLIITLALRRTNLPQGPAVQEWATVDEVLSFLVGVSDDLGPRDYAALMDRVYGSGVTILGLQDEGLWQVLQAMASELPPPYINSTFVNYLGALDKEHGWRFMGQRFTLDAYVLQNLVYDKVSSPDNKRLLPSGLDVVAALGSPAAAHLLEDTGVTAYRNYPEQLAKLQAAVQSQSEAQWLNTAFGTWLYAFLAQLDPKGPAYFPYMQSASWAYKDMNSALGSWAELKHVSTLYVKKPEAGAGGSQPASGPAPGYVEPLPDVFYRLAYLCSVIAEGLEQRGLRGSDTQNPFNLAASLDGMRDLATRFQELGDLADKELVGMPLEQQDYALVQAALGPVEALAQQNRLMDALGTGKPLDLPSVPVISPIAGANEQVLQAGVGLVDRIYVIISVDGALQAAQGGVFSYYEFNQPRAEPLTDQTWRQVILAGPEFPLPAWSASYVLAEGVPVNVLAFRVGDVYRITNAGGRLNVRASASLSAEVVRQLQEGEYVKIIDGPVQAQGFTWWKLQLDVYADSDIVGWAVENADWYERAWGQ